MPNTTAQVSSRTPTSSAPSLFQCIGGSDSPGRVQAMISEVRTSAPVASPNHHVNQIRPASFQDARPCKQIAVTPMLAATVHISVNTER